MVRRSIVSVCLSNLDQLPERCRTCTYWETSEQTPIDRAAHDDGLAKEHWYDTTLREWGSCGRLLSQGSQLLGYGQYAPPAFFPQLQFYPLGPVDGGAVFLSCLYVPDRVRGRGLGKVLLQAIQKDLFRRGHRAIETFALPAGTLSPAGWTEFYLANGFKIVREHGPLALLRLDLKATVSWQENVEAVLEGLAIPLPRKMKVPIPS